jgi:hypothetical protein
LEDCHLPGIFHAEISLPWFVPRVFRANSLATDRTAVRKAASASRQQRELLGSIGILATLEDGDRAVFEDG